MECRQYEYVRWVDKARVEGELLDVSDTATVTLKYLDGFNLDTFERYDNNLPTLVTAGLVLIVPLSRRAHSRVKRIALGSKIMIECVSISALDFRVYCWKDWS